MKSKTIPIIFAGIPMECYVDIADGTVFELCNVYVGPSDIIELLGREVKAAIEKSCAAIYENTVDNEARYPGEDLP